MMSMIKYLTLVLLLVTPLAIAQNQFIPYEPDPDAPTHERMYEEVFGVPSDATYLPEVFYSSDPHPLMIDALQVLWMIAVIAYIIIIFVQLITSTINAPTSRNLLGDNVSTAFAPMRLLIAFALLVSVPGKYSMIEAIVLTLHKYTSSVANEINTQAANKMFDSTSDLNFRTASLTVTEDTALNIFKGAMCVEYLISQGENDVIAVEPLNKQTNYQLLFGQRTNINFTPIFSIGGVYPIEGGCGQWYTNMSRPRGLRLVEDGNVDESAFVENTSVPYILQVIQFGINHRSLVNTELYNEFRILSQELINREEGVKDQYFVERFDGIVNNFNVMATKMLREKLQSPAITQLVANDEAAAIEDSINNGWFFAGAMPFALASVHDKYQSFKRTGLISTAPISENFYQHEDELEEHFGYLDKLIKGNRSQIDPATSLVNESIRSDIGGYGSCVMDAHGLFDCFGQVAVLETLHLADGLSKDGNNPLIFTHDVGSQGANSLLNWQIALNTAYVASSAAVGFTDNGYIESGFLSFISHAAHATVEILRSNSGFVIKYLMVLYTFLGYYIPLMAMLYFIVAVISYIVLLFVSILSANFFAVSHAWLEGTGYVSSYAQRGYPSFIFAALHPIFIVAAFYIYLFAMNFIFKYVGFGYSIAITQLVSLSSPNIFSGLTVFTVFVTLLIVIHRLLAKFTIDLPDRSMRTIGVHEALASNDFTNEIESRSGKDNENLIRDGSDSITKNFPKSHAPEDNRSGGQGSPGGGGGSGSGRSSTQSTFSKNERLNDTATDRVDSSHEAGSHFKSNDQGPFDTQSKTTGSASSKSSDQEISEPDVTKPDDLSDSGPKKELGANSKSDDSRSTIPSKVPNKHNEGITGSAMNFSMKAGQYVSGKRSSTEGPQAGDHGTEDSPESIQDNRSKGIREAQDISSRMEDSAKSDVFENKDDQSSDESIIDPDVNIQKPVISGGDERFDSLSDEPMSDEEFEKRHKEIKKDEDGPIE